MKGGRFYGYELASRLEKMTKGHVKVSDGTIYPFLRRMETRELLTSTTDKTSGRVYYELTPKGKLALKKLTKELESSKKDFDGKLLGSLAIYEELFGREALNELLKQV